MGRLARLDLHQPDERRLVLLLEQDDVDDAVPPASEWGPAQTPDLTAPWGNANQWGANFNEPAGVGSVNFVSVAICAALVPSG